MKDFNTYTQDVNNIFNPVFFIEGKELFINNGKDLDSVFEKLSRFHKNRSRMINEAVMNNYDIRFTINEQYAIKGVFVNCLRDYEAQLVLERDEIIRQLELDEGLVDFAKKFGTKMKNAAVSGYKATEKVVVSAKDKLLSAVKKIECEIKEVKEFIVAICKGVVDTVKKMAEMMMKLLEKISGGIISGIFKTMKFDVDALEKDWVKSAQEIAKNGSIEDQIKNAGIYEAYGKSLANGEEFVNESYQHVLESFTQNIVLEGKDKHKAEEVGTEVNQEGKKSKWKTMIWNAFKQLGIWAVVCVGIPGVFIALFPGTWIALLIPLICKLAWNAYSIVKIWRQIKALNGKWKTMSKGMKIFQVICLAWTIIALFFNFKTLFESLGPVVNGLVKSGGDLLGHAGLGITPDNLQMGFAAIIKSIKAGKFGIDDFGKAFDEIKHSFAREINLTETISKAGEGLKGGMTDDNLNAAKDFLKEKMKGVKASGFTKNMAERWNDLKEGLPSGYKYFADNIKYPGGVDKVLASPLGQQWMDKYGDILTRIPFKSSNAAGTTWSALYAFKEGVNGTEAMNALKDVMEQVAGNGTIQELGTVASEVTTTITTHISSILGAMAVTIPSIAVKPEFKEGFKVKLGAGSDKVNMYNIPADGIKVAKMDEATQLLKKHNSSCLNEINKQLDKVIKDMKDSMGKNRKRNRYKKIKSHIDEVKKNINNHDVIIYYGTKEDSKERVPVLFWSTLLMLGADLADSTLKGPRNYTYPMKGMYSNVLHYETDEGLKKSEIDDFLLNTVVKSGAIETSNIVLVKPYKVEDGKQPKKYEVTDLMDANEERLEFNGFDNSEIVDILNGNANAKDVLYGNSKGPTLARTKTEKEELQEITNSTKDAIEHDKETQEIIKKSKTLNKGGVIDKSGKVNMDKAEELINATSQTSYGRRRAKRDGSKGWFAGLFDRFLNWLYGRSDDEEYDNDYVEPKKTKKTNNDSNDSDDSSDNSEPKHYSQKEIDALIKRIEELEKKVKKLEGDKANESLVDYMFGKHSSWKSYLEKTHTNSLLK